MTTAATPTPEQRRRCLGGAVKRIRQLKKIKQDTLAQAVGVNPAYLSRIESSDRQPSMEVLLRLVQYLEVDLDDISYLANVYVIAESESAA
jgi:transcriptional regulator with XRE-family HTH domain